MFIFIFFIFQYYCKLPFSEKFTFYSKVQNVELLQNHCLHREVSEVTLTQATLLFLGLVTVTLELCLYHYRVTPSITGRGKRHEKNHPEKHGVTRC